MTTADDQKCIHPCPCTSDQECRHDRCGDPECPACQLIEDIEWATGVNGRTLVEQLAEFGLVIRVR